MVLKIRISEADRALLQAKADETHAGNLSGYVRTAAMEKAHSPATIAISGDSLTREGVERLLATLNGAPDRGQA